MARIHKKSLCCQHNADDLAASGIQPQVPSLPQVGSFAALYDLICHRELTFQWAAVTDQSTSAQLPSMLQGLGLMLSQSYPSKPLKGTAVQTERQEAIHSYNECPRIDLQP